MGAVMMQSFADVSTLLPLCTAYYQVRPRIFNGFLMDGAKGGENLSRTAVGFAGSGARIEPCDLRLEKLRIGQPIGELRPTIPRPRRGFDC
jgi:hypothetical protein